MAEVKNICLEALERHCLGGEAGRLDFHRGNHEGQIFIRDRLIIHAHLADVEGVPALFRLFDWGDAETTWQSGLAPEKATLHLTMDAACILYAENLNVRAEMEEMGIEHDQALVAPELLVGPDGMESVVKNYSISLECSDASLLPGGFTFTDANKSSYVIGSAEDCDIVLRHPSVEPQHCGVILERGMVTVWDLGAQSGIKLNGTPIAQEALKVGDVLTLGTLDLRVRFQLRRPTINRPKIEVPVEQQPSTSTLPMPKIGLPSKEIPKGPITYDKVSRQLKDNSKAKPFLSKLGSLFGTKDKK